MALSKSVIIVCATGFFATLLISTGRRAPWHPRTREEEMAMKSNCKIAMAIIVGFVLGGGAVSVLHAQAKLPAYAFVEIDVKDQDGYTKDFLPKAQANIKEGGGKYIAGGFNKAISMSGSPPPARVVLLQFPDMDTLKAFNVKQRQLEAELGDKYASFRGVAIEGVEQK
jgi:uncharacterized protein (DUF1330 family)